jgi:hypothetical protein
MLFPRISFRFRVMLTTIWVRGPKIITVKVSRGQAKTKNEMESKEWRFTYRRWLQMQKKPIRSLRWKGQDQPMALRAGSQLGTGKHEPRCAFMVRVTFHDQGSAPIGKPEESC